MHFEVQVHGFAVVFYCRSRDTRYSDELPCVVIVAFLLYQLRDSLEQGGCLPCRGWQDRRFLEW